MTTTGCVVVTFRCSVCSKKIARWGALAPAAWNDTGYIKPSWNLANKIPKGWVYTWKYGLRCASCNKKNLDPLTGERVEK